MKNTKTYWYIKYDGSPVRVCANGFEISGWSGWSARIDGICDITRFPKKEYALYNIKILRKWKSKLEQKKFKLVKVLVK